MPDNLFSDIIPELNAQEYQEPWEKEWQGMPEFTNRDLGAAYAIIINFENIERMVEFGKLIGQKISPKTRSIWFPSQPADIVKNLRYTDDEP